MIDLASLPGHTKTAAGKILYELASAVPSDQAIVEIGVFKAKSACYLGAGAQAGNGAHVWAIDPWDLPGERYPYHWKAERPSRHEFTKTETRLLATANVERCGLVDQITLVQGFGAKVGETWDGPRVGLIYIDGDHRARAIRADWKAWSPHFADGAIVAFDDHVKTCPDVPKVVAELVAKGLITRPEQRTRRLALGRVL